MNISSESHPRNTNSECGSRMFFDTCCKCTAAPYSLELTATQLFTCAMGLRLLTRRRRPPEPSSSSTNSAIILLTLNALKESADACSPLKSAVSGVLHIWELSRVSVPYSVLEFNNENTPYPICFRKLRGIRTSVRSLQIAFKEFWTRSLPSYRM